MPRNDGGTIVNDSYPDHRYLHYYCPRAKKYSICHFIVRKKIVSDGTDLLVIKSRLNFLQNINLNVEFNILWDYIAVV